MLNLVDPLNMGIWQKWIVLVVISICESNLQDTCDPS